MRRGCEGPVWPLISPLKPFSLSGQASLGRRHASAWPGWWQPAISTEDLAMPQARRRHLTRKLRKELTSREISPQSFSIPYKINTKLPEIHTNVNEIQNTKLLSTTELPKYYWPWQDGLSIKSLTGLSQWGEVHPLGPSEVLVCRLRLPSPHFSKRGSWASSIGTTWELVHLRTLGPHPDWLDQKLCFNQSPGVAGWQGMGSGQGGQICFPVKVRAELA